MQVFANLLRNGIQAAERQGCAGVTVSPSPRELLIDVWDSGPGVAPEIESTLFQPFVTTKRGGTGLGLAITRKLLEGLGWKLTYLRRDERTLFRLHLPRRDAAGAEDP